MVVINIKALAVVFLVLCIVQISSNGGKHFLL